MGVIVAQASTWYGRVMTLEGVVKFEAVHTASALSSSASDAVGALCGWRAVLLRLGLIGNVSARIGPFPGERRARPFVVSGRQTGARADVSARDFAGRSRGRSALACVCERRRPLRVVMSALLRTVRTPSLRIHFRHTHNVDT